MPPDLFGMGSLIALRVILSMRNTGLADALNTLAAISYQPKWE